MDKVSETAARFGVIDNMPRYLAMALGSGETTVLRHGRRLCRLRQWRAAGDAELHRQRAGPPRQGDLAQRRAGLRGLRRRRAGRGAAGADGCPAADRRPDRRLPDDQHPHRRGAARHRHRGGAGAEPADRRQDRHDERLFRQLVRRLHPRHRHRASGSASTSRAASARTRPAGRTPRRSSARCWRPRCSDSPPVPFRAPPGVALVRMQDGSATILEAFRPGTENSARSVGGESAARGTAAGAEQSLGGLY